MVENRESGSYLEKRFLSDRKYFDVLTSLVSIYPALSIEILANEKEDFENGGGYTRTVPDKYLYLKLSVTSFEQIPDLYDIQERVEGIVNPKHTL